MILITAQILSAMQTEHGADKRAFGWILGISFFIIALILLENFSTAVLLGFVILLMMFIGRVPLIQLGKLLGIIMLVAGLFIGVIMLTGDDTKLDKKGQLTEQIEQPTKK